MPSIQIDLPRTTSTELKRDLAQRIGDVYADVMGAAADLLTVSIHDLGAGGVWRCHESGPPTPAALVMCDIRSGRTPETRALLAERLLELCASMLDLDPTWSTVEFTQHAGDEMFHPHLGGFNRDWTGDERIR